MEKNVSATLSAKLIGSTEEKKKRGKGRPYKIYSLKIGFDEIIAQLEKQQRKAVEEAQARIKRLKELEPPRRTP